MNFEQLKYIVKVAKSGSLSSAAKTLHISQSALSQTIKKLEAQLGVEIFIRSQAGTTPTDVGNNFIQKATEILIKYDELLIATDTSVNSKLRIGTCINPSQQLVKAVVVLKNKYPNTYIEIVEKSSKQIIDDIINNNLDVGIVSLDMINRLNVYPKFNSCTLIECKMIASVHNSSPLVLKKQLTLKAICKQPLVLYDHEIIWKFIKDIELQYGPVNIVYTTKSLAAVRNAVIENLGITIGPEYMLLHAQPNTKSVATPIEIVDTNSIYGLSFIYLDTKQPTAISRDFFSTLESNIKNTAPLSN